MKKILVPTDFSQTSAGAFDFAAVLAQKLKDVQIILLHAWELPAPIAEVPFDLIKMQKEELKRSEELELNNQASEKIKNGLNIKTVLREGNSESIIIEAAKEFGVSIIVMGTLGNNSLGTEIFGSTASHMLEKASCPVIAIPPMAAGIKDLHKITYATDYHTADISAIDQLCRIAEPFHAQLNILHIADEKISADEEKLMMKHFMEKVNAAITYQNLSFQVIYGENAEFELEKFLASDSTDIIVLSTHRRSLFEKIFGISITKEIALNTNVPVMAFHSVPSKPVLL